MQLIDFCFVYYQQYILTQQSYALIIFYKKLQINHSKYSKTSQRMSYQPIKQTQQLSKPTQLVPIHQNPIYHSIKYPQPSPTNTLQSQIASSLLFQQLLYYNYYYSFLFFYLYSASQVHRLLYFSMEYGVPVRIIVEILFLFLEICRLYNAFHGNLKESFPQICAFLMMTILTIAAQGILISPIVPQSPLEWCLLFYGLIFHILQFIVCICTMTKTTQAQKALFLWRNPIGGHKNN